MTLRRDRLSVVAAALAACVAAAGCGGRAGPNAADGPPKDRGPPHNPPVHVTDEQLIKEWVADRQAAEKKYLNKVLEVSGSVSHAFPNTAHVEPKVYLQEYWVPNDPLRLPVVVDCRFRLGDERPLLLAHGQKVKIRGKVTMGGHSPFLEGCEVIEAGESTAAVVSPADLAGEFLADPARAKEKYQWKAVVVTGKVAEISGGGQFGLYSFVLETPQKAGVVAVRFWCVDGTPWHARLAKVRKGQEIKACGLCDITVGPAQGPPVQVGGGKGNLGTAVLLK
jgi:hypothetical protein